MSAKFKQLVDESGSILPGILKSEYGLIVDVNSSKLKKYREDKEKTLQLTREKEEMKKRLTDVESSLSEIKDMLSLLLKRE